MKSAIVALAVTTFALTPALAEGPAVSGFNGKLGLLGGGIEGDGAGALIGSFSAPLGYRFGVQIDGLLGSVGSDTATGIGAHLFWRDPSKGMLGLTASQNRLGNIDANRVGVEGEVYLEDVTLSAWGGKQTGGVRHEDYYGFALSYYVNDNLKLEANASTVGSDEMYGLGAEWQFHERTSAHVRGTSGGNNQSLMVGLQMTFGGKAGASLKDNHRYDDPVNPLFNNLVNSLGELRSAKQCTGPSRIIDCWDPSITSDENAICIAGFGDDLDHPDRESHQPGGSGGSGQVRNLWLDCSGNIVGRAYVNTGGIL